MFMDLFSHIIACFGRRNSESVAGRNSVLFTHGLLDL